MDSQSTKRATEKTTVFDEMLAHNARYAETFGLGHLQTPPVRKLVILTCMDSRMDLEQLLGLQVGDAHMIRNAGGLASDDAVRSLILSTHLLGTRSIAIIQHTECGLLSITDEQMRFRLSSEAGQFRLRDSPFFSRAVGRDSGASRKEQPRRPAVRCGRLCRACRQPCFRLAWISGFVCPAALKAARTILIEFP